MPRFKAGDSELLNYLADNIVYPIDARRKGIEGTVVVSFIVNLDGGISDVIIVKSVYPSCDEEILRIVKSMSGLWSVGTQDGVLVNVKYKMPVRFRGCPRFFSLKINDLQF